MVFKIKSPLLGVLPINPYGMTQVEFSELLGVVSSTYISWEQGRYVPSSPSQALLHVATYHKDVFLKNREQFLEKIGEFEDQGF